jgi:hypothetical protein
MNGISLTKIKLIVTEKDRDFIVPEK